MAPAVAVSLKTQFGLSRFLHWTPITWWKDSFRTGPVFFSFTVMVLTFCTMCSHKRFGARSFFAVCLTTWGLDEGGYLLKPLNHKKKRWSVTGLTKAPVWWTALSDQAERFSLKVNEYQKNLSQGVKILFCFANSQNTHYLCIFLLRHKSMSHLIRLIIRRDYTWLKSKADGSSLWSLFFFASHWKYTYHGFVVCQFDECPGHFRRVQMWGSWDPSWFRESIRVHKGRVSIHLLAWRDTDFQQKERLTADPHMSGWKGFFHKYSDLQHRPLFFLFSTLVLA